MEQYTTDRTLEVPEERKKKNKLSNWPLKLVGAIQTFEVNKLPLQVSSYHDGTIILQGIKI